MGYKTKKQLPLSLLAIVKVLDAVKLDMDEQNEKEARSLFRFGALIAAASLHRYEGFYLVIAATRAHLQDGNQGVSPKQFKQNQLLTEQEVNNLPSVWVCLIGKFKGETGKRYHSIVLANESTSGLQTRWWVERLIEQCAEEGWVSGFAFAEADGSPPDSTEFNALFRQYLRKLQKYHPDLFSIKEDVTRYGISRSLRKTAVTQAGKAGLSESEVSAVNRWRTIEQAKGSRPKHNMLTHYTDAGALAPMTRRYSYVLCAVV
jgi:hypothetical protein